jgi:phosphatidyl-myo-inositol dimannoside synthase
LNITIICQGFRETSLNLQPWRRIYEISKRMKTKGYSITILTDGKCGKIKDKVMELDVIFVDDLFSSLIFRARKLLSIISETAPEIVVLYGTPFSAVYLNKFKSLGKPLVWDIDTDIYNFEYLIRNFSKIPFREIIHFYLFQYIASVTFSKYIGIVANSSIISKIIVPNYRIKCNLCEKGVFQSQVAILSSTIDVIKFRTDPSNQDLRSKLGFRTDDFVVSFLGAPTIIRGADIAIRSMRKIIRYNKRVKLLILSRRRVGDCSTEEELNRLSEQYLRKLIKKLKIEDNVEIISGFLEPTKIREYLHASDTIVLPFRIVPSEPPLSIFEAMNIGKTVITTNLGGLPEILGKDRGIIIESGNSDELAEAILFLAKNPEKNKFLGENAQKFVSYLPTWDEITQQFEKILLNSINT